MPSLSTTGLTLNPTSCVLHRLFTGSPLYSITLCLFPVIAMGCISLVKFFYLQKNECLESTVYKASLSWKLRAGRSAYVVACPDSFRRHKFLFSIFLILASTSDLEHNMQHITHTRQHSKRERNKTSCLHYLLLFHPTGNKFTRDLQRSRQIKNKTDKKSRGLEEAYKACYSHF